MQERLGRWGTARYINIHREKLINTIDYAVALFEWTSPGSAGTHGEHILGFRHLVVQANDLGDHLLGNRSGHDHQVTLAWAGAHHLHTKT